MGVLETGIAMFALDVRNKPRMLLEWSGVALVIKPGVSTLMAVSAKLRLPLFCGVVVWSAVFFHAPDSFRHAPRRRP